MQSPLLGFNNNVKHRGRLFHIQTEDSGVRHPHVITHLFMDGGRILKTFKTSYAEHVGSARLGEVVRDLMKQQHKKMFVALREGHFDEVLGNEDRDGPPSGGPTSTPVSSFEPMPARSNSASRLAAAKAASLSKRSSVETPAASPAAIEAATSSPPDGRPSGAVAAGRAQRREMPDTFAAHASEARAAKPISEPPDPGVTSAKKEPRDKSVSPRNAASRPAAMFTTGRAPEAGGSIFGDDLISEKSLDEVILSYLSEDLDTTSSKK
ncbi:MAG TPA: hypothetical protein VF881_04375 [Polyangiaceae bacterium]